MFAAFVLIAGVRLLFPDPALAAFSLEIFSFKAKLAGTIAEFIDLFPAIFMSALVIPFALDPSNKDGSARFSESFFDSMKKPLSLCVAGTVVFAALSLAAGPLLTGYQTRVDAQSKLYAASRIKAERYAREAQWRSAAHFMNICEGIWKENPVLAELRVEIANGLEALRYARAPKDAPPQAAGGGGQGKAPLTPREALEHAEKAFADERYYDANWFADAASKLAPPGSAERTQAIRMSALSWNAIEKIEPSRAETRRHTLYKRKREGYEALVSGDVINAYYQFKTLQDEAPDDPDAQKYFELSRQGLEAIAFFYDEFDLIAAGAQNNAVFSIPSDDAGGRLVLRIASLARFENCAFGRDLELIAVDAGKQPAFAVAAELVKIIPTVADGKNRTAVLMHPVDRSDPNASGEPQWTDHAPSPESPVGKPLLILNLTYEDFLLAAYAGQSVQGLFSSQLWTAAEKLKPLGYIPQTFHAQMISRFYAPAFFLPFSIFVLVVAWKYRPKTKPRRTLIPMLFVLPLVLHSIAQLVERIFNLISIWTVVTAGWLAASIICAGSTLTLFLLALFLLAAQRGEEN
jgi:hypothetical protein